MYGVLQNSMGVIRSCVSLEFPGPFSDRPGELLQLLAVCAGPAVMRCRFVNWPRRGPLSVAFPKRGGWWAGGVAAISNRGAGCSAPSRVSAVFSFEYLTSTCAHHVLPTRYPVLTLALSFAGRAALA